MKKCCFYMALVALSLCLFSCSETIDENYLHGTWKLTALTHDKYHDEVLLESFEKPFDASEVIVFSADGTFESTTLWESGKYVLSEDGAKIVLTTPFGSAEVYFNDQPFELRRISRKSFALVEIMYYDYDPYPGWILPDDLPSHVEAIYTYSKQ